MTSPCPICALHQDQLSRERYEIQRSGLWVLRHHPTPAPLPGWMLLDTLRHCAGPVDFTTDEAIGWGIAVQKASQLVQQLTQCDRVYAIAFGEGAQHLHLHLIPRLIAEDSTKAWAVADHYRAVELNDQPPADPAQVEALILKARQNKIVLG